MTRRLHPILFLLGFLLAAAAFGQDETLAPDGENNSTTWRQANTACLLACDMFACDDQIDEAFGASDNEYVSHGNNGVIIFDFPTPAASPSTATNAQAFRFVLTKCLSTTCAEDTGGSDPTYDVDWMCGGVAKGTLASGVGVTGADQDDSYAFTYATDGDCDAAGANVQFQITGHWVGGGSNRRAVCLDIAGWEVTHAAAGGRRVLVVNGGK